MVPLLGRRGYGRIDGTVAAVHLTQIFISGDLTGKLGVLLVHVGVVLAPGGEFLWVQEHLLRVDEVRPGEVGQLVLGAEADRIDWTGFLAVAAEDAADHVDLVDSGVPLAGRGRLSRVVVRRLDEDGAGGAGGGAQLAADTPLEAIRVAIQPVPTPKRRRQLPLDFGVGNSGRWLRGVAQRRPEPFGEAARTIKNHKDSATSRSRDDQDPGHN